MESQPQNPKFRNNPENFHSCVNIDDLRPIMLTSILIDLDQCGKSI